MLVNLFPGDLVCDYASPKDANAIARAGYKVAARYICGNFSSWKSITKEEYRRLDAAGVAVVLIWEIGAADPLQGATLGRKHGLAARRDVDALQYGGPVVIAVDTNATASNINQIMAYLTAFREAFGGPVGVYGDWEVAERTGPQLYVPIWKPAASSWSGGRTHPATHAEQLFNGALVAGIDHGKVLKPFVVWRPDEGHQLHGGYRPSVPEPTLQRGSRGDSVKLLQQLCNKYGWRGPWNQMLVVDGVFGAKTEYAVKQMQRALGRLPDGVYGPRTARSLAQYVESH